MLWNYTLKCQTKQQAVTSIPALVCPDQIKAALTALLEALPDYVQPTPEKDAQGTVLTLPPGALKDVQVVTNGSFEQPDGNNHATVNVGWVPRGIVAQQP